MRRSISTKIPIQLNGHDLIVEEPTLHDGGARQYVANKLLKIALD
jgi:hypothetical protein